MIKKLSFIRLIANISRSHSESMLSCFVFWNYLISPSDFVECLLQIADDVLRILQADGETDQTRGDTGSFQFLLGIRRVGHGRRVLNQRLRRAEGNRQSCDLHIICDNSRFLPSTLDDKTDHTAIETVHLLLCDLVAFVIFQSGVEYLFHLVIGLQVLRDLHGVFTVPLHA